MQQQLSMFDTQLEPISTKQRHQGVNSVMQNNRMHSVIKNKGQAFKRHLTVGEKVDVYRNLNKPEFFSAKAKSGEFKNLVAGYAKCYALKDAAFFVGTGRLRVLSDQVRNVHAHVRATLVDAFDAHITELSGMRAVTYNPFNEDKPFFYYKDTGESIQGIQFSNAIVQGANVWVEK